MIDFLKQAAKVALPTQPNDSRHFWLGCIGIRDDGAIVSSKNGAMLFSSTIEDYQRVPTSHAEGRVLRKLGRDGILFVARVSRQDGSLKMSMPCVVCSNCIRAHKVNKVFYTINPIQYGIWNVKKDIHTIKDW